MSFPLQPLSALGIITTGSTPPTSKKEYWDGAIPFVTPSELDRTIPVFTTPRTLSQKGGGLSRMLREGAVMVSCIGSLGKVGIAGRPMATNQQINSIEFDQQKIWPKFGFYACQMLKSKLVLMAPATTLPIVSKSKFEQLDIPVPLLSEQRRIAAILDKADALRAKRREALAHLDRLEQAIFVEMFGDSISNPSGWPLRSLESLVAAGDSINYGVVQPGDSVEVGVPMVRVGDLIDGKVRHESLKKIDPVIESAYKRSRLKGDEILVSCVGSVGVVALVTHAEKGFNIARAVARIRLSDCVGREFLATQLRSEGIQRYFTQELRTVSQPTLNIKQLSETLVMLPPIEKQLDFSNRVRSLKSLISTNQAAASELEKLFMSLQKRAFNGEL